MNLLMQQDAGIERYRKPTRRDMFLAEMDRAVPRAELCAVIARDYPKAPVSEVGMKPAWAWRLIRSLLSGDGHVTDGECGAYQPG
jgi:transposase, IS4 family